MLFRRSSPATRARSAPWMLKSATLTDPTRHLLPRSQHVVGVPAVPAAKTVTVEVVMFRRAAQVNLAVAAHVLGRPCGELPPCLTRVAVHFLPDALHIAPRHLY